MSRRPACQACPLSKGCLGPVPGTGPAEPKLVLVGEAPGKHEDLEGLPFVGPSGRVLDEALTQAGLSRRDVYLTNTVKCRPPRNRTPVKAEVNACRGVFLNNELERFRHVPWVLLGSTAISAVGEAAGGVRVNQSRSWRNSRGVLCFGTWHPAAVLRGAGRTDMIAETLARAGQSITHVKVKPPRTQLLAVDTETDGLDPFRGHRPFLASTANGTTGRIYFLPEDKHLLQEDLDRADTIVMHNALFDTHMLMSIGLSVPLHRVVDTRINAALADSGNHPYALVTLIDRYFGRGAVRKHQLAQYLRGRKLHEGYKDIPPEILEPYAIEDAALTWALYNHPVFQSARLLWPGPWKRERELFRALLRIEARGIPVDLDRLPGARQALDNQLARLLEEIRRAAGSDFNPSSIKHVQAYAREVGLETDEYTRNGNPSYSRAVLERSGDETAHRIAAYRHLRSIRSNALDNIPAVVAADGRIHPAYDSVGSETGRFTGKTRAGSGEKGRINLLGLPDTPRVRSLFCAPPGFVWLSIDYKQIEQRGLAHYSQDPQLVRAYQQNPDADFYRLAGRLVFQRDITDQERKLFKAVVLARGYGAGAQKIAKMTGQPLAEVEQFLYRLDSYMPGVAAFFQRVQDHLLRHKRIVAEDWPSDLDPRAAYQGVNRIVQGACAVMLKKALIELENTLDEDECCVLHHVHDEINFAIRPEVLPKWVPVIRDIMLSVFNWTVPVRLDIQWGPNWGETEPWTGKLPQERRKRCRLKGHSSHTRKLALRS